MTPPSGLESLDVGAKTLPLSRRIRLPMESHPVILRNTRTNSKKNLVFHRTFFDRPLIYCTCVLIALPQEDVRHVLLADELVTPL